MYSTNKLVMYSINMKLWDCHCGTGKNCGSCPYGTYHYCINCFKIKPEHTLDKCPEKLKKVHFSTPLYINNLKYKEHMPSIISKKATHLGLEPKHKNGFVLIFNKGLDGHWFVLLQKRGPYMFMPNHIGAIGGRKENDETDLDAVIRETNEELGYLLNPSLLLKFNENEKCGWYMTNEFINKNNFDRQKTINELSNAPSFKVPNGLAPPPYGHFWINIIECNDFLKKQERMNGLEHKIFQACKYI